MEKKSVPEAGEIQEELASYWTWIWSWIQILLSNTALSKLPHSTFLLRGFLTLLPRAVTNHPLLSILKEAPPALVKGSTNDHTVLS